MKNYIYEPMWTKELEEFLEGTDVERLAIEMFYKYGLKVYAVNTRFRGTPHMVMMTYDGLPYCGVFTSFNDDRELVYNYYSEFYTKQRGKDMFDRRTLSSKKLSSLMKTLENNKAVPTMSEQVSAPEASEIHKMIESKIRTGYKAQMIDTDSIHMILKYINGDIPKADLSQDILTKCKTTLDEYNKVDIKSKDKAQVIKDFFENGVYVIGEDTNNGFIVNKLQAELDYKDYYKSVFTYDEPFQRVQKLEDCDFYDDVVAQLTMMKVYTESSPTIVNSEVAAKTGNVEVVTLSNGYVEDLNMACQFNKGINSFNPAWLVIPASK